MAGQLDPEGRGVAAPERPARRPAGGAQGAARAAEATLAGFRAESEAGTRAQTLGADAGEIAGLDAQLVAATVARAGKEATLERLRRLVESGRRHRRRRASSAARRMLDNLLALKAELLRREAELAGQYGQRHPKILAIRAEKASSTTGSATSAERCCASTRARWPGPGPASRSLAAKLEELKGRALRREATAERTAGARARGRAEPAARTSPTSPAPAPRTSATGTVEPDARLISEAVPPIEPSFPKPQADPVAGADRRLPARASPPCTWPRPAQRGLRSEREVAEVLGLPTLAPGAAPGRAAPRRHRAQDYALERPRSRYAEALREILTGLLLRRAGRGRVRRRGRGSSWSPPRCRARASRR